MLTGYPEVTGGFPAGAARQLGSERKGTGLSVDRFSQDVSQEAEEFKAEGKDS